MPRSLSWPQCLNQVHRQLAGRKEQRFVKLVCEMDPFSFMKLCDTLHTEKKKKILDIRFSLVLWVELPPPSRGEGLAVITLSWFHMSKMGIK